MVTRRAESPTKVLSRDDIQRAVDTTVQEIPCPEWGGVVLVKPMMGTQRDAFEASIMRGTGRNARVDYSNLRAKTVAQVCCDADGNLIFTEEDVIWLGKKSAKPLDRIFMWAQDASGISRDDIEAYLGNSRAAQSGDSTSD